MNTLNPRQEKFAQLYVVSGNATASYREACGASDGVSAAMGWKWLRNHKILERINELRGETAELATITRAEIVDLLVQAIETPVGDVTPDSRLCEEITVGEHGTKLKMVSKIAAIKELNRMCGHYAPEKVSVSAEEELKDLLRALTGVKTE